MTKKILIETENLNVKAELNDSRTASLIWKALPCTARTNTWGEEIYFDIPVNAPLENPVETVNVGDLAYWPEGPALCIFFGPTPVSRIGEIRPASAVNIVGKIDGDAKVFASLTAGEDIRVSLAE